MPINVFRLPCIIFLSSGSVMRLKSCMVTLHLSLLPPIPTLLVLMTTSSAYRLGSVRLLAYQLHQGGFRSCYSEADGKSAKSFNVVKMSPTGDSGATGQTGSHDQSDRSFLDRPPEPTGQTVPTQSGSSSALSTIGRIRTICAGLLKSQKIWTSWAKVLHRLIL